MLFYYFISVCPRRTPPFGSDPPTHIPATWNTLFDLCIHSHGMASISSFAIARAYEVPKRRIHTGARLSFTIMHILPASELESNSLVYWFQSYWYGCGEHKVLFGVSLRSWYFEFSAVRPSRTDRIWDVKMHVRFWESSCVDDSNI